MGSNVDKTATNSNINVILDSRCDTKFDFDFDLEWVR
jgi:hypothetical protein